MCNLSGFDAPYPIVAISDDAFTLDYQTELVFNCTSSLHDFGNAHAYRILHDSNDSLYAECSAGPLTAVDGSVLPFAGGTTVKSMN